MKYLGLTTDSQWTFGPHYMLLVPRVTEPRSIRRVPTKDSAGCDLHLSPLQGGGRHGAAHAGVLPSEGRTAPLLAAMENNEASSEEESDEEGENEDDKTDMGECNEKARVVSTLSIKDVEDALESFSGDKSENVE